MKTQSKLPDLTALASAPFSIQTKMRRYIFETNPIQKYCIFANPPSQCLFDHLCAGSVTGYFDLALDASPGNQNIATKIRSIRSKFSRLEI